MVNKPHNLLLLLRIRCLGKATRSQANKRPFLFEASRRHCRRILKTLGERSLPREGDAML
ncbi:hypothetical protein COCC4DRAFT_33930, partial [Bipolaris maydis ATCC 48331]